MNIDSIEMWLCDFKRNHQDFKHIHQMAQVLQFKFGQELHVNMSQLVKELLVKKKREEIENQVVFEETQMEMLKKVVKQDDTIKFKLKQIQIVQRIFNSWEAASEQLLADEILHHQISNMLAPTNISIDMNTQSNLNLDRTQIIKMVMDPINMSQDYKDIELLYALL